MRKLIKAGDPVYAPEDIEPPQWNLWIPRRFCRVKHAVMLCMNLEPTKACRHALRQHDRALFEEYHARYAIAKARAGHDLPLHDNHFEAVKWEGEKLVDLQEFLSFAERMDWRRLEDFEKALAIFSVPSSLTQ